MVVWKSVSGEKPALTNRLLCIQNINFNSLIQLGSFTNIQFPFGDRKHYLQR